MVNYRPIAILCSTSKLFEKLILKLSISLIPANTGSKKKEAVLICQLNCDLLKLRPWTNSEYVLVASLSVSAAFVINIKLLIKPLKILQLPDDVIQLINEWLTDTSFYVDINGESSTQLDLLLGTVQGSILGPIQYALFVSPH
jgi:hypothetical protein